MGTRRIRLIIESDLEQIPLVGMAVSRLVESLLPEKVDPLQMELCVVEAVTNSVKHAYGAESRGEVEVIFALSDTALSLRICDEGSPLDQTTLENRGPKCFDCDSNDPERLLESGRGLAVMKSIMDEVSYGTLNGKNCLTLLKRLDVTVA